MSNLRKFSALLWVAGMLILTVSVLGGATTAYAEDGCPDGEEPVLILNEWDGVSCKPIKKRTPVPPPATFTPTFTPTLTATPTATQTVTPAATATETLTPTPPPTATATPNAGVEALQFNWIAWVKDKIPFFPGWPHTGSGLADQILTYPYMLLLLVGIAVVFVGWYSWKGKTWEDFWAWLNDILPFMAQIFTAKFWKGAWQLLQDGWDYFINLLIKDGQWLLDHIWDPFATWAVNSWNGMVDWTKGALNTAENTGNSALNTAEDAGKSALNTAEKTGDKIEKGAKKAGKKIKKIFK